MKKILLISLGLIAGSASAQSVFNVPVQPPEMRAGYGLEGKGMHTAVPYGRPGVDCVVNPVSMSYSYVETKVTKLVAGQVFTIPVNVLFDFDGDQLSASGNDDLRDFFDAVVEGGAEELLIIGHTDSKGSHEYNLELGLRRAGAVATALVGFGFDADAIEIGSAGETEPKVPNAFPDGSDDPDGRQTNRRVDIEVVKVVDQEITNTEVVRHEKNPQIFHRLASNNTVACGDGNQPTIAVPVGGSRGLTQEGGIVITTVPR